MTAQRRMGSDAENRALTGLLRGLWPSLPALLLGSVAVCLAGVVTELIAPGISPVAVLLAALLVSPFLLALMGVLDEVGVHGEAGVATWWHTLHNHWRFAVKHALPAAVPMAIALVSLRIWVRTSSLLVLPSLAVTGGCAVVGGLGLLAVLSLGVARPDLRGRLLWICALHLIARQPLRFLAAPCVAGLGIWAATHWTASLLLLVPAPAMVMTVAAVRTTLLRFAASQ